MLSSLGVSHNFLRLIDRAQFLERWMVYIGMFCIVVLLLLVFWWKRM